MNKKVDMSSYRRAAARDQALKLADGVPVFQVAEVFAYLHRTDLFYPLPKKECINYAQEAVDALLQEREIEVVTEYRGRPRGWVFRRANVLDRIVGAIENSG